jgi:hypothetical protein
MDHESKEVWESLARLKSLHASVLNAIEQTQRIEARSKVRLLVSEMKLARAARTEHLEYSRTLWSRSQLLRR